MTPGIDLRIAFYSLRTNLGTLPLAKGLSEAEMVPVCLETKTDVLVLRDSKVPKKPLLCLAARKKNWRLVLEGRIEVPRNREDGASLGAFGI